MVPKGKALGLGKAPHRKVHFRARPASLFDLHDPQPVPPGDSARFHPGSAFLLLFWRREELTASPAPNF